MRISNHIVFLAKSADVHTSTDPILTAASASSFKSKDDVKNIFQTWYTYSERSKKKETSNKQKSKSSIYYVVTLLAVIASSVAAGYFQYSKSNLSSTAKANARKRQLQRKQLFAYAQKMFTQTSSNMQKVTVQVVNFLSFVVIGMKDL